MAWPGTDHWLGVPVRARADADVLERARRARGARLGARIAHPHPSAAADARGEGDAGGARGLALRPRGADRTVPAHRSPIPTATTTRTWSRRPARAGFTAGGGAGGPGARSPSAMLWPRVGIYGKDGRRSASASRRRRRSGRLRASQLWRARFLFRRPPVSEESATPGRADRHGDQGGQPRGRRIPARSRDHADHLRRPRPPGDAGGARPIHVRLDPRRLRPPARRLGDARRPDPPRGPARRSRVDRYRRRRSGPGSSSRCSASRRRRCSASSSAVTRSAAVAAASAGILFLQSARTVPNAILQRRFSFLRRLIVEPVGDARLRHRLDHRDLAGARRLGPRYRPCTR